MTNIKDKLSTICGYLVVITGGLIGVSTIVTFPPVLLAVLIATGSISGGIIGLLTGKNPNGTTKQIDPSTGQQSTSPAAVETATK